MDLLEKFRQNWHIQFDQLSIANCRLLLAVSGGIDSIALIDIVYKTGFDFKVAHCNFQLRGEESERDETFVRSLQDKYGKEVLVKKFDTESYAVQNKISIQEAARELRYKWFDGLVNRPWVAYNHDEEKNIHDSSFTVRLATAHYANDNIETLLINFFRGTGIGGLHGIPVKKGTTIRPLLFAKREDITIYVQENGLRWVEDSSNLSDKYTRNFFRLRAIPAIKEVFPDVEENLLRNIGRLSEAELLYQQAIKQHLKKLCKEKGNEIHIPIIKLEKTEALNTIIWEVIQPYHFHAAQVAEVKKMFTAKNGSYITSGSHRIIKNRNWLIIAPAATEIAQNILIGKEDKKIKFENGEIFFEYDDKLPLKIPDSNLVAALDASEIEFPLLLRKWKPGDYFYPLGMQKKKKLGKFFIDQKLSKTQKEQVWIIEMNKKIIWIIGYRIDNRFKINPSTKKILRLIFSHK